MDISEFKKAFVDKNEASENFKKYRDIDKKAYDKYRGVLFCLFRVFDGVESFPDEYINIPPISIKPRDEVTKFDEMKFNVKEGKIINIYFSNSNRDFLKYGELLSFFKSDSQIDELLKVFESVRDNL